MSQPGEPSRPRGELELGEEEMIALKAEIQSIIDEHKYDTAEFQRQLIVQRRLYELKPRRKSWPWPGASNSIVPTIRNAVDYYKGRLQQGYRQTESICHGNVHGVVEQSPEGTDWKQIADDAATVCDYVLKDPSHVNIFEFLDNYFDALAKDGSAPVKCHFVERMKKRTVTEGDSITEIEEPFEKRVRWDVIDLQRHVWTVGGSEPDDMPVIGHWMDMTYGQFRKFANEHGVSKLVTEKVLNSPDEPWFLYEEKLLDEEIGVTRETGMGAKTFKNYRVYELTVEWQRDDEEDPSILSVWWHHGSSSILKVFDPADYAKPYEIGRFLKRGRQYLGAGIGDSLRVINLTTNTIINQTIDAQTIANAFGFLYKADSRTAEFLSRSMVFPGCKIPFDDEPDKEFKPFQLGAANTPISIELLEYMNRLGEMTSKVGPMQNAQIGSASRVAASVGLGSMQESSQMVDSVQNRSKDMFKRLLTRTLMLYANNAPEVFDECLPPERATALLMAIRDPSSNFPNRVKVDIKIASASANDDKDKQDLIVLANFMLTIYDKIAMTGVQVMNPQAPVEFKNLMTFIYKGMASVVKQLVSKFDQFRDPNTPLPPEILALMEQIAAQPPVQPMQPGAEGGAPPPEGGGGPPQ